jgi:uncharacterized RDD family membrane protein YckC
VDSDTQALTLDGHYTVLTPEYVEFSFVLAGLMSRFLAWLIDALVSTTLALVLMLGLSLSSLAFPGIATAFGFIVWFLVDWGYALVLELAWSGQTIGKRALGLRVIQESGVRVGFTQSLLRNLARPIDRLPLFYAVGGLAAFLSPTQQRLGDLLAGTVVVRERRLRTPASLVRPEGDAHLLEDPDFRARVARLSSEEESVFISAALRREELGLEARLTLFAALARRLEARGVSKPAHLSDEKLVLLVTAALVGRRSGGSRRQK